MKIPQSSNVAIVQVGSGGTGGYLVPKLARLIMTLKEFKRDTRFTYTIVDPDSVEEANLYRQNFVQMDLGKNKAQVMAQRYGRHFGVDISSCNEKISAQERLQELFLLPRNDGMYWSPKCTCVLISCVDNNAARRVMHDMFHKWDGLGYGHDLVYIDSGNGKYTGQIVTGYREFNKIILPPVGDIFPDALVEDEKETHRTCTQNALENPQNIGANDLASTMIFSVLNILLTEGEVNSHIISFDGRRQEFVNRTQLISQIA
jgi:PRTRC genetic system ThiF family protein